MEHAGVEVLLDRKMLHTGEERVPERPIIGPFREDAINGRVVNGRLAMGVLRNGQAFPLHPGIEHPQNEVKEAMIAKFALWTTFGHREVREDKCVELGFGELDGNGRGCWVFCLCSHGSLASCEDRCLHPTESGFPRYYKSLGQFAKPATSSEKAIRPNGVPKTITIDGNDANEAAIKRYNEEHGTTIHIRQVKYFNNIVEQDHRAVKRITRSMLGFKAFDAAQDMLVGIELMHMLKKRQRMMEGGHEGLTAAEPFYSLAA
jgi:DDE domain